MDVRICNREKHRKRISQELSNGTLGLVTYVSYKTKFTTNLVHKPLSYNARTQGGNVW